MRRGLLLVLLLLCSDWPAFAERHVVALREPAERDPAARLAAIDASGRRALERVGERTRAQRFATIPALVVELTPEEAARLAADPDVASVGPDVSFHASLGTALPLIHASDVQALGPTGKGVRVAILDTGVEREHPDLARDVVAEQCFCERADGTGCCPGGAHRLDGPGSAPDEHGHGTSLAGILTSDGRVAGRGVAPDAEIVAIRVMDEHGAIASLAQLLEALDWLLLTRPDVRVVNLSLETDQLFEGSCDAASAAALALSSAIRKLRERGTLVVAAAGNRGDAGRVAMPACLSSALAVGAVASRPVDLPCGRAGEAPDRLACFSNAGPRLDLVAPGAPITTTGLGGGLAAWAGTSQASAMVAGAAALLFEASPGATPEQVAQALRASGVPALDPRSGARYPRIDVRAALRALAGR